MRSVIVVSPYFPPSTLAGVHRARHLAKYLPTVGWTPVVLCVDEAFHEQPLDPGLAWLVPESVDVVKVPAMPAQLTRPFGLGEISIRAFASLRAQLVRLLQERSVSAVLITGAPFYPMLLAPLIRKRFGVPVVLDFQDPWVSPWGATQPPLSKAGISHRLACLLEPRALAAAAFVTTVSELQREAMAARYPWLGLQQMAAIPIGCDHDDFSRRTQVGSDITAEHIAPGMINLSFVGTFMPRSEPVMRILLTALAHARAAYPSTMARVRFNFVGTSNQPGGTDLYRVLPLAKSFGVGDAINEVPQRVPYLEALNILAQSDGLLLIGSDEPHYTASKIYPALMSGRPYVSLFHRASSAHQILCNAGGGFAIGFSTPEELVACELPLVRALLKLVTAPNEISLVDSDITEAFTAGAIAAKFGSIFDRISVE